MNKIVSNHYWVTLFYFLVFTFGLSLAHADEYRPAYLEFNQISDDVFDMLWKVPVIVPVKGEGQQLGLHVGLADDITTIKPLKTRFVGGAFIETSSISRQGGLAGARIRIEGLTAVSSDVLVGIHRLNGATDVLRLNAATPSFVVASAPNTWDVFKTYLVFGVEHIWQGIDHLLFVACLIFIARTWRRILVTITGFTVAHSVTLTLAALEWVRLPVPPIEACIALSIVFLAREIVLERRDTLTWRYPIAVSSTFGLLHGFGFASALSDIGLPQTEIPAALLAFNVGVEIGQVVFVAAILVLVMFATQCLKAFDSRSIDWLGVVEKPIAYGVGSITLLWTIERVVLFV